MIRRTLLGIKFEFLGEIIEMKVTFSGLKEFYKNQGFNYSDELLFNFYCSLKTKPFVILSGISGSGKSKIIDLFSSYFSNELSSGNNYELVPVKPNWVDSRSLFGYHNVIDNTYAITPVIKLFLRALQNPEEPYFLVLDEMNLAKVEHYFSDFLSLIESRRNVVTLKGSVTYKFKEEKLSEIPNLSLPDLTLVSAIEMNLFEQYASVPDIRGSRLYSFWIKENPNEITKPTWKERSRTEINNKVAGQPGRFAPKFFMTSEHDDKLYRIRTEDEIEELLKTPKNNKVDEMVLKQRDIERFQKLLNEYFDEVAVEEINTIVQEPIVLHQSKIPLKVDVGQSDYTEGSPYYDESSEDYYVPNKMVIPLNVYVIGTVNIDETTYMFSPKVLDRSNVIEFNEIDLRAAYGYDKDDEVISISEFSLDKDELDLSVKLATSEETIWFSTTYPEEFKVLVEIFEILKIKNKHFGYRVFNEISAYVRNYLTHLSDSVVVALDNQILQKVLPKLNGDEDELEEVLVSLQDTIPLEYTQTHVKLEEMFNTLKAIGYVTFIK